MKHLHNPVMREQMLSAMGVAQQQPVHNHKNKVSPLCHVVCWACKLPDGTIQTLEPYDNNAYVDQGDANELAGKLNLDLGFEKPPTQRIKDLPINVRFLIVRTLTKR